MESVKGGVGMESTETLPGLLSYAPCGQDDPASQPWTRGRINPLACNGSVAAGLPEKAGSWEEQETISTLRATSSERKSGFYLIWVTETFLCFHIINPQLLLEYAILLTEYDWPEHPWVDPQIKLNFPAVAPLKTSFSDYWDQWGKQTTALTKASPYQPRADVTAHNMGPNTCSK